MGDIVRRCSQIQSVDKPEICPAPIGIAVSAQNIRVMSACIGFAESRTVLADCDIARSELDLLGDFLSRDLVDQRKPSVDLLDIVVTADVLRILACHQRVAPAVGSSSASGLNLICRYLSFISASALCPSLWSIPIQICYSSTYVLSRGGRARFWTVRTVSDRGLARGLAGLKGRSTGSKLQVQR